MTEIEWWIRRHYPDCKIVCLSDHLGEFDNRFRNPILDEIPDGYTVYSEYLFPNEVKQAYPMLTLGFAADLWMHGNNLHAVIEQAKLISSPATSLSNFLCCFNRAASPGRHLLLYKLYRRNWYNPEYCTKHFELDVAHLKDHYGIDPITIDKKFVSRIDSRNFSSPVDHVENMAALSPAIQACFINLVPETKTTESTVYFPTEKFLYAVANRRLWVAMAAPNYHKIINQKFGFKLYSCFDYLFDSIWQPEARMDALLEMLQKFSNMTIEQWEEIYQEQQDAIEYNYQHLTGSGFIETLNHLDEWQPPS